jgi:hypothetical protein
MGLQWQIARLPKAKTFGNFSLDYHVQLVVGGGEPKIIDSYCREIEEV